MHLTESAEQRVPLTAEEAATLRSIGQQLASKKDWWGASDEDDPSSNQTVVRCNAVSASDYLVRISDAIGVIGLQHTQLVVNPKISLAHLLFLFAASQQFPRHLLERTHLETDSSFHIVVATWFTEACEVLLRHGLASDYSRVTGNLGCARGRIEATATARSVMMGRPVVRCDYDIRSEDTSLNRVVKGATLRLLSWPDMPADLRRRCRRIGDRLTDIRGLRDGDTQVRLDPLTSSYKDVLPLALMILESSSISICEGAQPVWTFLYRTPDAVEAGVRDCLQRRLHTYCTIEKRRKNLQGDKKRSLNPDLVFGHTFAVGDIKYKHRPDGSIGRSDLNQITTFATGYRVNAGVVIAFGEREVGAHVRVGPVAINCFNWNTTTANPADAADALAEHLQGWLAAQAEGQVSTPTRRSHGRTP
ncbi:hypothetical protein [Mycobacterium sp. DBP42]|uniref:5-methylcytosine restriction system specificity protein McrC n=1 Tax=Mycobacterium sp. DBP42 TaxID=2545267 RepID=UPI001486BE8B|nr:hypothetical protein [Mycobacterium sp. DBP42]